MPKYVREVYFIMWKKIILSLTIVAILVIGIEIFNISKHKTEDEDTVNVEKNITEISSNKYITDDCVNEWEDYAVSLQEEIEVTAQYLGDENKHYILKAENNYINVYYINEKYEEILYKPTQISTEYLPTEDIEKLRQGLDIYGTEELNKLLEDFE